jgi:hypothetical protein
MRTWHNNIAPSSSFRLRDWFLCSTCEPFIRDGGVGEDGESIFTLHYLKRRDKYPQTAALSVKV